jgi:hypothetical protein
MQIDAPSKVGFNFCADMMDLLSVVCGKIR